MLRGLCLEIMDAGAMNNKVHVWKVERNLEGKPICINVYNSSLFYDIPVLNTVKAMIMNPKKTFFH